MNASHVIGGLQHDGETQHLSTLNHGFGFTVPADTRSRTLRVYVATNRADGTLTATLSDGSAAQFVDVLPQAVDLRSAVYTISYAAASANQTLTVNWVETADNCSTHLPVRQRGDLRGGARGAEDVRRQHDGGPR